MGGLSRQRAALERLAARCGVLTSYRDWRHQWRQASSEVLVRVLAELGVPIATPRDAEDALRAARAGAARDDVSPVAVARGGRAALIDIRVAGPGARGPDAQGSDRFELALSLESGQTRRLDGSLAELPAGEGKARRLAIRDLPDGYHHARLEVGGRIWETLIIACPERAYTDPGLDGSWGMFAPTYALRSRHTAGAGSLAELGELSDRVAALGGSIVGTLPLTAGFYDQPFEPSPYSPASRLFWNELFVDLRQLADIWDGPEAQRAREREERGRAALSAERLVDYRAQMAHVRPVIEAHARGAWAADEVRAELEAFARARPRADDYAQFRAAAERYRAGWSSWPERPRSGALTTADFDDEVRRYHLFAQYVLSRQLGAFKGDPDRAGLYLDLPVGVSREGYDAWRERDAFALDCSVGAPPDALFLGGQNWALPPLHPERIRRRGYRYVIDCVRAQLEHAAALRIDHVMGLHRLYWIPEGVPATEGVYVRYPDEELYAILILESHRQRCELIGEDLGTVPDEVPEQMERAGMGRLHVAQFSLPAVEGDAPAPPSSASVASFGTHDTPSFAGFWAGRDIEVRLWLGLISEEEAESERRGRQATVRATEHFLAEGGYARESGPAGAMRGIHEYLAASEARIVLMSLDDLWLDPEPHNVPGTTSERPNWRLRMDRDLDAATDDPAVTEVVSAVKRRRRERYR